MRARLQWCANIATLLQRFVRGHTARQGVRRLRARAPVLQAYARGLLARFAYRRVRFAATALAAGARGMAARRTAAALYSDPARVAAWGRLVGVRRLVDSLDERLEALLASRKEEMGQLKLALCHEHDKLGEAAYRDAPAVGVMLQQERLAATDAEEIAVGLSRSKPLIALLAQVPYARAADAGAAVAAEVTWLHDLVEVQSRRDELYRPATHRPAELLALLHANGPGGGSHRSSHRSGGLSRDEQLDSYRSVSLSQRGGNGGGGGGHHQRSTASDAPPLEPLTEEELAIERARRQARGERHCKGVQHRDW